MDLWIKERILGTGNFGIISLWRNTRTDEKLALKECRAGLQNTLTAYQKKRWCAEIEIMLRLNHQNIVKALHLPQFFENNLNSSNPVLCMEYCSRGDLRQTLNSPENSCGLRELQVRNFLRHIKNALEYLHGLNITHRDIKPENILLEGNSDRKIIYKLTDLGYAKEHSHHHPISSTLVGTLQYLAPELFAGESYGNSVDYWSFGLLCHEVVTGLRPFIPQAHPSLSWMNFVKEKRREHICIYQSTNGSIRYSSRIFQENRISQCLQLHLEKWLQCALEWNPKKRGYSEAGNKVFFSQLDDVLAKQILTIYCCSTNSILSYEVENSTAISTLQKWIERDTKLKASQQLLLSISGSEIEQNKYSTDYYQKDEDIMIFVYDLESLHLPSIKVKLPGLVSNLMENPLGVLNYFFIKRTVAHTVFFVQKEIELLSCFTKACKIRKLRLAKLIQNSKCLRDRTLTELNKLLSNRNMSEKLLKFDLKCYDHICKEMGNITALDSLWQKRHHEISEKIEKLLQDFHNVKRDFDEIISINVSSSTLEDKNDSNFDELEEGLSKCKIFLRSIYKYYANLPRDKGKLGTPLEAIKIIQCFLGQRRDLLENSKLDFNLQNLHNQERDIRVTEVVLHKLKDRILNLKSDLLNTELSQRKEIWNTLAAALIPKSSVNTKTLTAHEEETFSNSTTTLTENSNSADRSPIIIQQISRETESILSDNEIIRNKFFANLDEMINKYRTIKDESESIDWTFLK